MIVFTFCSSFKLLSFSWFRLFFQFPKKVCDIDCSQISHLLFLTSTFVFVLGFVFSFSTIKCVAVKTTTKTVRSCRSRLFTKIFSFGLWKNSVPDFLLFPFWVWIKFYLKKNNSHNFLAEKFFLWNNCSDETLCLFSTIPNTSSTLNRVFFIISFLLSK